MSDIRVVGNTTATRNTSDGGFISPRADRSGIQAVMRDADILSREGRVYVANMGTVTTVITFLVTAANRPDAWIRVPSGTTILPLALSIAFESMAGTDTEVDVRTAQNDIGNGTSSAADIGPRSNRTDAPLTSNCVARQLATGDTTAETNPMSIWRHTYSLAEGANVNPSPLFITREAMGFPVLVGPATWEVFVAATTTQATGFVVMIWAEVPSNSIA